MDCIFPTSKAGAACTQCGWKLPIDFDETPKRNCPTAGAPYILDTLADGKTLWACRACEWTTIGTDEQPDHCCGQKECLHLGDVKGSVKVECCSGVEKQLTAHECAVHVRCLPGFVRHDAAIAKWNERKPESDLYHLCCICTERADKPALTANPV